MVEAPEDYGINDRFQLVQDFLHPPYVAGGFINGRFPKMGVPPNPN